MSKTLRIPNEPCFVQAFALAVDPGDTLGLLLEIGALGSPDVSIVRRTREALEAAYDRVAEAKDWEQVHTVYVLRKVLAEPDSAAYLAYRTRGHPQVPQAVAEFAEALAVIGCAADTPPSPRRPWEIAPDDIALSDWREQVTKLLRQDLPGNALPNPGDLPTAGEAVS